MELRKIKQKVSYEKQFSTYSWDSKIDINEVIDFFVEAKQKGATHVEWDGSLDYDGEVEYCTAQPFFEYIETEEQAKLRIKKEEEAEVEAIMEQREKERAEYERLKEKFG